MARHTQPVCKLCRNEGRKLFFKGSRCNTPKCGFEKRPFHSGQHGQARKKQSEYAIQLREKNKVRHNYLITEKQFSRYFKMAEAKTGVTGTLLLQLLESRLDCVVFRSGLVLSKPQARQLVRHRHFLVNGRIVDIPSYKVKPGDKISVKEKSQKLVKQLAEDSPIAVAPPWMTVDKEKLAAEFDRLPNRDELDTTFREQLIIEFYSR
jgi:small subunit ribosomal protein S4